MLKITPVVGSKNSSVFHDAEQGARTIAEEELKQLHEIRFAAVRFPTKSRDATF